MRSPEERISSLHQRAEILRQQMERRALIGGGSASGILFCALVAMLIKGVGSAHVVASSQMTASSLLDTSAGGYVLVAVVAFLTGVILTAAIRWYRSRDGDRKDTGTRE